MRILRSILAWLFEDINNARLWAWVKFAALLFVILCVSAMVSLPMYHHGEPDWFVVLVDSVIAGLILYAFRKTVMEALDP